MLGVKVAQQYVQAHHESRRSARITVSQSLFRQAMKQITEQAKKGEVDTTLAVNWAGSTYEDRKRLRKELMHSIKQLGYNVDTIKHSSDIWIGWEDINA